MGLTLRHAASTTVLLFGLVTACAGGEATTADPDAGGIATGDAAPGVDAASSHDSGSTGQDSGSTGTDGGGVCMANCTTDSECQSTCPPAPGNGVHCCDVGSGVCFASSQGTCPSGTPDSGLMD